MADDGEIAKHRERLAGKTRAELIHEQRQWQPHAPQAIAATQLLDELDSLEQQQLKLSVDRLSKPHRLLWWTFAVALLTLIVSVIGYWDQIVRLFRALKLSH